MKTQIISAISACLFSLVVVSNASAQQPKTTVLQPVTINPTNIAVTPRVIKAFNRSFANAENVKWYANDKRFLVKFKQDEMNHHAVYLKGGYQIYHIGYGFENNLPANVKSLVESRYSDYTITRSFIIDQDNRNLWIVSLKSPNKIISAAIENGQVQEVSSILKSPDSEAVTSMIQKK